MLTITRLSEDQQSLVRSQDPAELDRPGLKWVDLERPDEETLAVLGKRFGLHKLALEDCLHLDQRPKLEEYPNHLFLVVHGFSTPPEDVAELVLHELHLFIGPDFVISVHELHTSALEDARKRLEADVEAGFSRGPDFIAYTLVDALVDRNFPVVDAFNDELEDLEEEIYETPSQQQLQRIFQLKRALVQLRRMLSPQRDVLSLLTRGAIAHIQERTTLYFRDVFDHLVRLLEQVDAARDLLSNARDGYMTMVANRTNDISKQLTIFATIFLPLSFITGFFGQNFDAIQRPFFFWLMLGSVFLLPVAMVIWFFYKRWL